ncbi:hypothetical protein AALB39_06490 [Lachnospiraceae bacterium 54-53]
MSVQLPKPIALYMDSLNSNDSDILNVCITEDAHVHDIGENSHIIVTSLTSGEFPGSPQLFYYFFTVKDDLITNIEIVPGEENAKLYQ